MAINIEKLITQIDARHAAIDSNTSTLEQFRINQARDRLNNSGVNALTYNSTGQLPSTADSAFLGTIAYVRTDNVFGDSDGAFYMATARDSNWVRIASTQDSDEAAIAAPEGGGAAPSGSQVQGTAYGFKTGGEPSPASYNVIDRYSFTSDGNATDYGDLTVGRGSYAAGCTEKDNYGYTAGGYATPGNSNVIDRFPYASAGNAADVGDLAVTGYGRSGASSPTNGYAFGRNPTAESIERFPFAASASGTDIGDHAGSSVYYVMTASSSTTAYMMGGNPTRNTIEKMPFASDGSSVDANADLLAPVYSASANSSETHGYTAGGYANNPATAQNVIQKFDFASEGNATDVGDLTRATANLAGSNSSTHGYAHGGQPGSGNVTIEKWSYSADGNSTDVGDLTVAAWYSAQGGQQV